jgi:2-iminoacetate synthase
LDELRDEIDTVREQDIRVIELVFASDPGFTAELLVRYVAETVKALDNEKGSGVLLCSEYLSLDAHRALRDAGLAGIVQWDETLDRLAYHRWHAASPHKREFRARMDNHDRALSAGLEVATGALLGLADFRYDVLMQVAKARHFVAEHGRGPFVFGTARLRPIAGRELHLRTCLTDRAYETALMVYRVAVPGAGRWLQTRETFEMNLRNVLDGDVFTYRCGDVRPGGYHGNGPLATAGSGGQFGVNELERGFVERELAVRSFRIDYGWMTTGSEAIASTSSSSFSPSVQGPCPDAMLM